MYGRARLNIKPLITYIINININININIKPLVT